MEPQTSTSRPIDTADAPRRTTPAATPLPESTERAVLDAFPPAATPAHAAERWHPATRVAFRFALLYLVLYNLPFPLGTIPGTGILTRPWSALWEAVVPWVGRTVLRTPPITVLPAGSGDTTWNYVQIFCFAVLAALGTALWSALDRRTAHRSAYLWLRVYVRFSLGASMIGYGAYKVIKSQFPFPSLDRLAQPFGDASPMGLLWTFMGYSTAYNVFTGLGEIVGGALLFFRRTTTLGALILITVLANIVILNFAYDVPVKLFSSHLLVMAMLLTLPDVRRLVDVLVRNRPTYARPLPTLFAARWKNRTALGAKLAFLALALGSTLYASASGYRTYGDGATPSPLFGLYDTEEFVRAGVVVPPSPDDVNRWRRVSVGRTGTFVIRGMPDDHRVLYRSTVDADARTVRLVGMQDTTDVHVLGYEQATGAAGVADRLVLHGTFAREPIRVTLRRRGPEDFLLVNRGFHWINEFPFNR